MSSPAARTDVLIAGAGPVGLAMAVEVARYGLSVRIVDKSAQRTDKSKAIVIWSRTLEHFARMGCASQFLATGLKVPRAAVVGNQKPIGHVELSGLPTPYPFALMIPQSDTERLLEEYLATFGVIVERSTELKNFHPSAIGDSVTSTLLHSNGREESVTSSWLLGCDGSHSTVRHQLGFNFHGDTLSSDWILADVHLSGVPATPEISIAW
ncbi:MAG TPA: FAD-dependent monooxygenase, partial [Candidatus Acidoferrum sp.]|nr:FAD-dependent monooxygenase [Candidatus Acidoferrum sp.]